MQERQIIRSNSRGDLSATQLAVAEYLSMPGRGGMTYEQLAEKHGISLRCLYDWRQNYWFAEHVRQRTMEKVIEHLPDVMEGLTRQALEGKSIKAVDVWLRANGLMNQEMTIRPGPPAEDRSEAAIRADIERMRRELGFTDNDEGDSPK
ncbi:phBC6A51 family helix-turn-helix protein [Paenibacillus sp. MMO-177]|uniref:phBC6A51 family helix-turn-helix protein n=1 Tax=Paenibacillus sp. MMO-177 TaxID=3081289 RepID=UPI003017064C